MKDSIWSKGWVGLLKEIHKRILKSDLKLRTYKTDRFHTVIFSREETYPLIADLFRDLHAYTMFWVHLHQSHPELVPYIAVAYDLDNIELRKNINWGKVFPSEKDEGR